MVHTDQMTCSNNNNTGCFFCTMAEPDPSARRSRIAKCFKELPLRDDKELVIILSGVWRIAVAKPDDPEFPSLGVFHCMTKLINGGINDRSWLSRGNNMSIPYYAAHIIGSYTMNKSEFAEMAVRSGVVIPLMELLRGKMSWVEQRVAVRALGHIASHRSTFKAAAAHELEIVKLTMKIVSNCIETVYNEFVNMESERRMEYHCELMGKGVGGLELQNKKAEAWASQLQCWSLYLLNCFARKKRSINLICKQEFLRELSTMWGGLENQNSFSGIGLIRSLCLTQNGRESIANSTHLLKSLCNLSRSSDDSQIRVIKILLSLLEDANTRYKVLHIFSPFLVDLVELRANRGRSKLGDQIARLLLQDYAKIKFGKLVLESKKALEEALELKVERRKRDKLMSEREFKQRRVMVSMLKKEGNQKFWSGKVAEAAIMYKKALDLCPLKLRKERIVLHSNRAQCFLIQGEAESAISDTTRALCLSGQVNPHLKSLWRRSQAYDMKGMSRESLMDCMVFINACSKAKGRRGMKIPYYAIRMLNKQMNSTWIFTAAAAAAAKSKRGDKIDDETQRAIVILENAKTDKKKKKKFLDGKLEKLIAHGMHQKKGLWRRISIKKNGLDRRSSLDF